MAWALVTNERTGDIIKAVAFSEWEFVVYTVFLAGGIASGKSTVARILRERGAYLIDLDEVSREVMEPGGPCALAVAAEFGKDLISPETGAINRALLAKRAFDTAEDTARLEAIELPFITERLLEMLTMSSCAATEPKVCVVEIPLLDRVENLFDLADEILAIITPLETRRRFAIGRGMAGVDFDNRVARQTSDEYLRTHATYVIENTGTAAELKQKVDQWWEHINA